MTTSYHHTESLSCWGGKAGRVGLGTGEGRNNIYPNSLQRKVFCQVLFHRGDCQNEQKRQK